MKNIRFLVVALGCFWLVNLTNQIQAAPATPAQANKYIQAADKLAKRGDCLKALEYIEAALKIDPNRPKAHRIKADCLKKLERKADEENALILNEGIEEPGRKASKSSSIKKKRDFGIGLLLGSPTGITAKKYLGSSNKHAIEGVLGWSLFEGQLQIRADYVWEFPDWIRDPNWTVSIGAGGFLWALGSHQEVIGKGKDKIKIDVDKATVFGGMGVGAVAFNYREWEFFGELSPLLAITPAAAFRIGLGVGARYYF